MKSLLAIFVLVSLLAFAHCFPGLPRENVEDEGDGRPRTHQVELIYPEPKNFDNDRDTFGLFPFSFNWRPIRFDFSPRFGSLRDLMKMMTDLFNDVPSFDDMKPFGGKIPEGANTTSITKIVDGNVVTVNETTYTDSNDNSGTFIRVRVVHIKPENETTLPSGGYDGNVDVGGGEEIEETTNTRTTASSTQEETTPARSVETVEEFGNEIPRSQADVLQA
ncbi:icarapin-like [Chelonus insularis]|uniref:icarapin-like n=1 Tax=Chelonus insularis TaxID=460826 RepID=UPI00158F3F71|nr:icarapin-like [Chelonus insularis]